MTTLFASQLQSNDLHALMLAVGAEWVRRYHPRGDAALMVTFGPGVESLQYPLNSPDPEAEPLVVSSPSCSPEIE